jgi:hypothetical protein
MDKETPILVDTNESLNISLNVKIKEDTEDGTNGGIRETETVFE